MPEPIIDELFEEDGPVTASPEELPVGEFPDDALIEMPEEPLSKRLHPDHPDNLHGKLLTALDERFQRSKRHIEQRYDDWALVDKYMRLYLDMSQPVRNADKSYTQGKKEHPYKRAIAVPLMYHVLMTRISFLFNHFTSSDPFVHLEAIDSEGWRKSRVMEARLNKDVRDTKNNIQLYQLLFDNERYGICAWKLSFEEEWEETKASSFYAPEEMSAYGIDPNEPLMQIKSRGNRWRAVNPRQLLLDTEMAAGEARKGEYIGDWTHINWLHLHKARLDRREGPYINVDQARRCRSKESRNTEGRWMEGDYEENTRTEYPLLEIYTIQWELIPTDWDLGDSDRPEVWEFAVSNQDIIVRAHRIDQGRGGFTYYIGQGDPDNHSQFTCGMGQQLIGMQQVSNFLATSHIVNARKAVNDQVIFNDDLLNKMDFKNPSAMRHIRLTREGKILNKRGMDIQNMYGQLAVTDITAQHMETLKFITADAQRMAATPDTMQGMPLPSKRTLGEIENVNQSATVRLGITAQLIDLQVVEPCMLDAVHNLTTKLDSNEIVKLTGRLMAQLGDQSHIMVNPDQIQGQYEYIARTPTMAKDPARSAAVWGNVMQTLSTAPDLLAPMPDGRALNPHAIFNEYIRTLGIDYFDQFYFEQPAQPAGGQLDPEANAEQIDKGAQSGNMVPIEEYFK